MRVRISIVALAALAAPVGAQDARQAAASPAPNGGPSVEGYVCTFTGKCGGAATTVDATMNVGETKGFRLARAVPDKPAASPTRSSYASSRSAAHAAVPVSYGHRTLAPAHVVATLPVAAPLVTGAGAGMARPRADLMIGFERNSARLSSEGAASATIFAQSLFTPDLAGKRFMVEGHTDLRGGRQVNMALSARRAEAVTDYLVLRGVDRSRLFSRGVGPDVPLPGHSPSDPGNRRVEAELLP